MRNRSIEVEPIAGALGAEISGVDLGQPVGRERIGEIRQALLDHGVIFFRDQTLTPEQHVAFAEGFGPINVNRFFVHAPGYPMIAEVRKEPEQKSNIGSGWHTDHSYDEVPALGSILLAREVPEQGGDTMFANMALAYETLSDGLKKTLDGLRAVHSSRHVFGADSPYTKTDLKGRLGNSEFATQDAVHPVVTRHPETGRKTLYVNPGFTLRFEGWTSEESEPLLKFLYAHATRPEFTCRFRWRPGSIAFWDNRATWHCALNDYQGERRLMHRITIEGTPFLA
jgi:taurine dioxygenase